MIVVGFVVVGLHMSVANVVLVRHCVFVIMLMVMVVSAGFARRVIVAATGTMFVRWRRLDRHFQRRFFLNGMLMFMLVIVVVGMSVIMSAIGLEVGVARLPPQNPASRQGDHDEGDAAEQDIEVKLRGEQALQHRVLPKAVAEPKAQANHAKGCRQSDHAKLIDEVSVRFLVRMVVRVGMAVFVGVSRFVFVRVRMFVAVIVRVVRQRITSWRGGRLRTDAMQTQSAPRLFRRAR